MRFSSDDLILYTITSDSTLRIYFPVLDSPQYVQLHAAIDLYSSISPSLATASVKTSSAVFWLDRQVISQTLEKLLNQDPDLDDVKTRTLRDIQEEGWDLFLRVIEDGCLVLTAVAVISITLHSLSKFLRRLYRTLTEDRLLSSNISPYNNHRGLHYQGFHHIFTLCPTHLSLPQVLCPHHLYAHSSWTS